MFVKGDVVRVLDDKDAPELVAGMVSRVQDVQHGHVLLSGGSRLLHSGRFEPVRPLGALIEFFPVTLPGKGEALGSILKTGSRASGRRIVVHTNAEGLLFDTGDQYDLGNALNCLERWLVTLLGADKALPF